MMLRIWSVVAGRGMGGLGWWMALLEVGCWWELGLSLGRGMVDLGRIGKCGWMMWRGGNGMVWIRGGRNGRLGKGVYSISV